METLTYRISSPPCRSFGRDAICGVVGSGNLEVLIQRGNDPEHCDFTVITSVRGFGPTWKAVLEAFSKEHACGGTRIAMHDLGATPAVVFLRLSQSFQDYTASEG